ncbi:cation:proton antiporter [Schleiferia thermophila]|jgi:multicomponent Na+:H+ antiporter subunit F|uniref:cation:proton antiporter n=1 Tax=Schleiferia thermophila TaxID=884107 RepID=UPI0004E78AF8|nr:cation:proton antiporter [Schleiferia thermophila]KFD39129.1 cation:proton antiporter [Schleiferia thermophila str. Yellowstone]PMB37508.1 cation:proton antiporter [Fischerella thermalis CCMEE 5319]
MTVQDYLYFVILPILVISMLLVFYRFLKGPSMPDRIVAVDLLITIGIGIIAIYSIVSNRAPFLDIAMVLALIAFLSTVAFSYYIEKKNKQE